MVHAKIIGGFVIVPKDIIKDQDASKPVFFKGDNIEFAFFNIINRSEAFECGRCKKIHWEQKDAEDCCKVASKEENSDRDRHLISEDDIRSNLIEFNN